MSAVDLEETEAHEAAEPTVEANPKIGRYELSYLEPRVGLDGLQYAGQCAACSMFISEASMMGSVVGDRCVVLGSSWPVNDDSSCRMFLGWGSGIPCAATTDFYALEMRKGIKAAMSPSEAVYIPNCNSQCISCKFYSASEEVPGRGDCGAFYDLNEKAPNMFDLDCSVHPRGGCSLWRRPEEAGPPAW